MAPEVRRTTHIVRCLLALVLIGASSLVSAAAARAQAPGAGSAAAAADSAALPAAATAPADSAAPPPPAEPAPGAPRVRTIRVEGAVTVDSLRVLSSFLVTPGDPYRVTDVRDGVKALYRLDLFSQVDVKAERDGDFVDLVVVVVEAPRISAVEFTGNREIDTDKLREKLTGTTGKVASEKTRGEVVTTLADFYKEEGFPQAEVLARFDPGAKPSERLLVVELREGAKVQVNLITFTGNEAFNDEDLRGKMDTKQKSFWKKGHLRQATVEADLEKIKEYYQRNGYRDIKVPDWHVTYAPDGRTADIEIQVVEGRLYTMGSVRLEGNSVLPTPLLQSFVKFRGGDRYNRQKIDESAGEIGGAYADRGYLYCQVDAEESLDSTVVNVVYRVNEQEPSKVREIRIVGNTRTKEKVIRRQLYLYPGQRFDRALLIRSQRELFQLGFFQNVEVDFRPLPNSYDVDLVLNVEEKPVGTASAGAGFSSQGGLTGFLELGHPNLFGNGQAVNLRLERGSKTSAFEFSFTEPWFRDSPTTVGLDLFRTNQIRDIYEVKRTGGSLRFGRPVPGVPYTRMFGNYSFERTDGLGRVTIDERTIRTDSITDSLGYSESTTISLPDPVQIDPGTRNSSGITLGITRNSTDHPIYARTGSATTLTWELAGGFLQGNVRYNKVLFDGRFYLKALSYPKATKPAFMFRTQFGAVGFRGKDDALRGDYPPTDSLDVDPAIPEDRYFTVEAFELFRLGGTSRGQSLRGYADYEVVPDDNVRPRTVIRNTKVVEDGIVTERSDTSVVYDTFPGGQYYGVLTFERQFTIVEPLHGALFAEAGGTWNDIADMSFNSIHKSLGFGLRMEIPLLGLVGFDYAYGFDRLDRSRNPLTGGTYSRGGWQSHLLFGRIF